MALQQAEWNVPTQTWQVDGTPIPQGGWYRASSSPTRQVARTQFTSVSGPIYIYRQVVASASAAPAQGASDPRRGRLPTAGTPVQRSRAPRPEQRPFIAAPESTRAFLNPDTPVLLDGRRTTFGEAQAQISARVPAVGRPRVQRFVLTTADRSLRISELGVPLSGGGKPLTPGFLGRTQTAEDFFGRPGRLAREQSGAIKGTLQRGAGPIPGIQVEPPQTPQEGAVQGAVVGSKFGPYGALAGGVIGAIAGALRGGGHTVVRYPVEAILATQKVTSGQPLTVREQFILANARSQGLVLDPNRLVFVPDPALARRTPTAGPQFKLGGPSFPSPPRVRLPSNVGRQQQRVYQAGQQLSFLEQLAALQARASASLLGARRRRREA